MYGREETVKIVLQNLTKRYPNRNKKIKEDVIAVNNFNFEIPDGKLIGLLGPSGCGKSTTLNMICGLEKPTEGKIFFGEDDVTELPPENRGVGMVFQSYALYPHLTVLQNIMFPLENRKGKDRMTKEEMRQKAEEAARLVQIDQLLERKPSELSGGQQQRVACFSMSPCPTWTRGFACRRERRSEGSRRRRGSPQFSSPTTRKRP